ncbi:MAG: hypothetical protein AAGA18_05495 [Verrucomicrobiota bacterium]
MILPRISVLCAIFLGALAFESKASQLITNKSGDWPITIQCDDVIESEKILKTVTSAMEYLAKIFGADFFDNISLNWIWYSRDREPLEAELFPRSVYLRSSLAFKIEGWNSMELYREQLVRTTVLCVLQGFWLNSHRDKYEDLEKVVPPEPPYWLVEGLVFGVLGKEVDLYQKVITRFDARNNIPTLEEIQNWDGHTNHYLEKQMQRVFCRRLVMAATSNEPERKAIRQWIKKSMNKKGSRYWVQSSINNQWWKGALRKPEPKAVPIMTWEETASQLSGLMDFSVFMEEESKSRLFSIKELPEDASPEFRRKKEFEKILKELKFLQSRGAYSWIRIIESYYFALKAWLINKHKDYLECIAWAEKLETNLAQYQARMNDLMDWAEVNFPMTTLEDDYLYYHQMEEELQRINKKPKDLFGRELKTLSVD